MTRRKARLKIDAVEEWSETLHDSCDQTRRHPRPTVSMRAEGIRRLQREHRPCSGVRVDLDNLKTRGFQEIAQAERGVPIEVTRRLMHMPQERSRQNEMAPWAQYPDAFRQSIRRSFEMLEHLGHYG